MNHPHSLLRHGFGVPDVVSPMTEADHADRLDLQSLLTTLRRRMGLFLLVFGLVLTAAAFLTARQPTLYRATAEVVLNMHEERIAPDQAKRQATAPADRADTEVEVLKSRSLAGRVARALNLAADPSFNPALAARVQPAGWRTKLFGGTEPASPPPLTENVQRETVDRLLDSLSVTRIGETVAMQLAVTTGSPVNAARIANEYVNQYTQGQLSQKVGESGVATRFLARRLEELRVQAQVDTARVQHYRIANNLLSTSGASLTEQQIANYSQAVAAARAQTSEDLARLNTARAQMVQGSRGDDVGEALQSPVVAGLRARQAEVSGRLATLQSRYGQRHPDVLRTTSELADINRQIQAEIARVISNLDARVSVSRERLQSITQSLSGARGMLAQSNAAMTGLDDLQRRAQASQSLYESYLNRYKEAVAEGGTERPDATVISHATVPLAPISPRPKLNMLLGAVLGLGAGLVAAFVAEMMFSGLTTGSEVEQKLRLPYMGGIPLLSSLTSKSPSAGEAVTHSPQSSFAEAFRSLFTSIGHICNSTSRLLLITSALPQEGKTTTAICLARTIARQGERTLLIDLDVSRPDLSDRLVSPEYDCGLLNVLRGEATREQAVVADSTPRLDILPMRGCTLDANELVTGPAMATLLGELRSQYDCIVIDTAPVLPIATTRTLAAMVDAVVFVVRWRHTPDHAINAALRLLPERRIKAMGVVLSRIDMRQQVHIGRGDASFYHRRYRSYYHW